MIIRDALPSDAKGIIGIWNPLITHTAVTFTTELKTDHGVMTEIDDKQSKGYGFFVAESEETLLGFASYSQFRDGPGYKHSLEHTIVLAPNVQGRGIGATLLRHLIDHATLQGGHVLLAGVSGENPDAVGFHKALGFEQVAVLPQAGRKFDRWMDLILLQKLL